MSTSSEGRSAMDLPEGVNLFLHRFQRAVSAGRLDDVADMYEREWRDVSHKFFEDSAWPNPNDVYDLTHGSDLFMTLYSLLYHRHILYSLPHTTKTTATAEQYIDAWPAYVDFFNFVLDTEDELPPIPPLWLYDTLSDFQDHFSRFQSKIRFSETVDSEDDDAPPGPPPLAFADERAWQLVDVIRYYTQLIETSRVTEILGICGKPTGVQQLCGYFSLVNLSRLHAKLGDYTEALSVVNHLNLRSDSSVFVGVIKCHVSLFYYIGFSLMMCRRFADALAIFSRILLILHRTRHSALADSHSPGGMIKRKADQMLALLAVCVALSPGQRVDELVTRELKEKYGEHVARMTNGTNMEDFEDLYRAGCPKFVSPTSSEEDEPLIFAHHLTMFKREVAQRLRLLPATRSYLQLYTNIDVPKLARFCGADDATMVHSLVSLKMKSYQRPLLATSLDVAPVSGAGSHSEHDSLGFRSTDSLHFYGCDGVVHVEEQEVVDTSEEHFIRQIGVLHGIATKTRAGQLKSSSRR